MKFDHNAYQLSQLAECGEPDKPDSRGARFLLGVQDAVNYALTWIDGHGKEPFDGNDMAHDIADAAVPIYTYEKWQTFVDLAAWQEDLDEYASGDSLDLDDASNLALYVIARRLAEVLFEEASDSDAEADDTNKEEYCDECGMEIRPHHSSVVNTDHEMTCSLHPANGAAQ